MSGTDIPRRHNSGRDSDITGRHQSLSQSVAERSILADLEAEEAAHPHQNGSASDHHAADHLAGHGDRSEYSMVGSYRRVSAVAYGPRPLFTGAYAPEATHFISEEDRTAALGEERSLLRDNEIIPPKHPRDESNASGDTGFLARKLSIQHHFIPRKSISVHPNGGVPDNAIDDESIIDETTPLVRNQTLPYGGEDTPENINKKWDEAVAAGKIHTTWQREAKTLWQYSRPMIATFALQFSLPIVSVFTVGHIGKTELGAVSLGSMSANITGFAVFIGLATSLDTLCAQAYGSGNKKLVGLQLQRMVYFLWVIAIPIGCLWAFGPQILMAITPEKEIAHMAGRYLRVVICALPGYAAFESGKRFVQAQGLFQATLYVLLVCAPLNVFLHWLLVWHFKLGYIGAPIALAIVENTLPIGLFLYVRFVAGMECWPGFSKRALQNWGPMIRLAMPGLIMVEAEFLAFEILTLSASYISATHLATQSILSTISALTYQFPFSISIAASTRIANLIGATLVDPAKLAAKVALWVSLIVGILNGVLVIAVKQYIPYLFTSEEDVAQLTTDTLPINAAFQLFDALAALANGILRGLGRQEIGGYVSILCYYVIAMPISFATAFGLNWGLLGLWAGPALALGLVAAIEGYFIYKMNWEKAVEAAHARNVQG